MDLASRGANDARHRDGCQKGGNIFAIARRLCLALLFPLTMPAWALPQLPVGTSPAVDVVFNFDFTGVAVPPPIVALFYNVGLNPLPPASGFIVIDIFGDPDGVNLLASTQSSATNPLFTGTLNGGPVPVLDGLFSIGLRATPGSVANFPSIDAAAILLICDTQPIPNCTTQQTGFVEGQISQVTPVPEPATLALIAIAVAGIAGSRREYHRRVQRHA